MQQVFWCPAAVVQLMIERLQDLYVARFGVMTSINMMKWIRLYFAPLYVLFKLALICCVCSMVRLPAALTGKSAMYSLEVLDATGGP
jgi:hypothetical protein